MFRNDAKVIHYSTLLSFYSIFFQYEYIRMLFIFKFQGVLLGLSNTAGVLAGVFGTAATGYILQRGECALCLRFQPFYIGCRGHSLIRNLLLQVPGMMCLRLLLYCT